MHEASLIANLLRHVNDVARAHRARRVVVIRLKVGPWSHCSPEHLQAHFAYAARDTIAAEARLEVEVVSAMAASWAQDVLLDSIEVEE
jgi:Zn finger protein HypA/HybF involved in hydrogenase expression